MITVKTLRKLLEEVPDYAEVSAYEGEDIGFNIDCDVRDWWITANQSNVEETYTEGFSSSPERKFY
jgi:hypothetical protein